MGNLCCGLHNKSSSYSSSSMVWAASDDDEEWVSVADCISENASVPSKNKSNYIPTEKQSLLGLGALDHDDPKIQGSSSSGHRREQVKIKISKKELEELLGRGRGDDDDEEDVHSSNTSTSMSMSMSIPLDQLLSRLLKLQSDREDHMNNIIHHHFDQRSAWRPILQTIPELN